jgi:hypothetical protein
LADAMRLREGGRICNLARFSGRSSRPARGQAKAGALRSC